MAFTDRQKTIAMSIIKVFETGKPLGDYAAVAVLNDGAGISYGISQFTHKSGSLYAVLARFQKLGGTLPAAVNGVLSDIKAKTNITAVSNSSPVKNVLKTLGKDALMQQAQREIAFEKYLQPSIKVCEGSGFVHPLSLAVIYDSKVHGSYDKIRDRVPTGLAEKAWIARYVDEREKWLNSIARLKPTVYRPKTFKALIAAGNWGLDLPFTVHGAALTEKALGLTPTAPVTDKIVGVEAPAEAPDAPALINEIGEIKAENVVINNEAPAESPQIQLPSAETIQQQIPRIATARTWLGTLGLGGIASTTWAAFNDLQPWQIFTLGVITAVILIGLVWLLISYNKQIFGLVKWVTDINANPRMQNIELVSRTDEVLTKK